MEGLINWLQLEKMTNWAMNKSDEAMENWDKGADGWQRRIEFEKEFTEAQANAMTEITKKDTVLDACCGTGRLSIPLARRAKHVYAVDGGIHMLEHCKRNATEAGLNNVTTKHIGNWHECTPGKEIPIADIAVACISPAQADIIKFSKCAKKYCYFLSFSKPLAYRHVMMEIFDGVNEQWGTIKKRKGGGMCPLPQRMLGMNVPFNILYDAGANPTISYADGGWKYTGNTKEDVYEYLSEFGTINPGKEEQFRMNCDKRIEKTQNGKFMYYAKTQMFVLGWDPNALENTK